MRLRRRKRAKAIEEVVAEMPRAAPGVQEVGEEEEIAVAQAPAEVVARPDRAGRRRQREFVSMEKLRRMQGHDEAAAGGDEAGQARLIIRETGAGLSPEPRQAGKAARGAVAPDAAAPADPEVPRLVRQREPLRRTHDVAVEIVGRARPKQGEESWEPGRQGVSWRWSAGMAAAILVLVISALVVVQLLTILRRGEGVRTTPLADFEVENIDHGQDGRLLEESPGKLYQSACGLLAAYCAATTADEALVSVRHAGRERELFTKHWQPCPSPPNFARPELIQYALMASQQPPAMVLWGLREDFSPFRAYFVHEDGRMTIDWRATEGYCDIPIAGLSSAGEFSGVTVRCLIETKAFHTAAFPEEKFRSFLISGLDAEDYVWGYAELGGDLDLRLRDLLQSEVGVLQDTPEKGKQYVTLVLAAPAERQLKNQFLISEMLHIEWVTP